MCVLAPLVAHADLSAPELQARGEQLAKDGRYTEAIEAFKAADHIEARASHACLIALAYTRRELWPQAEIFLDKCHQRASAQDPLPEWVPEADAQIKARIAEAKLAPIEIVVEPGPVELSVSSFPPDESFSPRTIHLPPGHHVISAKARGYQDAQHAVDVVDETPQHVVIQMTPIGTPGVGGGAVQPGGLPPLVKYGGIVAGAGVVSYAVMSSAYFKLKKDTGTYNSYSSTYDITRVTTIGLWAVGAGMIITGYLTRSHEEAAVAIVPTSGGGVVSVGWQR